MKTRWWRRPGDETTAELKVAVTPSYHMCSSSMSHHLVNLVVTPSARSRRQFNLTERRNIIPKPSLFLFIACSFNMPTHGSDGFVMVRFNVLLFLLFYYVFRFINIYFRFQIWEGGGVIIEGGGGSVTNQWSPSRQWRSMEEAEKLCLWFRPVFILVVKTV